MLKFRFIPLVCAALAVSAYAYSRRALHAVIDFVAANFLSLARDTPDFSRVQRSAGSGAITQAQARSFMQRLMQRSGFANPNNVQFTL